MLCSTAAQPYFVTLNHRQASSLKGVCFEKLAEMNVIEAVILLRSAKPYLGAKVQSLREKRPERELSYLPTVCRSPEV